MQHHHNLQESRRMPPSLRVQLLDVFFIELSNWRWSWRMMLVTGTLAPLFSIAGLGVFAHDSGRDALSYIQAGNIVLALMFSNMGNVQSRVLFMRFSGVLDYFATLPLRKPIIVLAVVMSFLLLSLPSLLVITVVGALLLHTTLQVSPFIIVVIPLSALPLSGIGAWVGTKAHSPQSANTINLLLTMLLMSIGPVIIPPQRLPAALIFLGYFSPATYAASAIRQVLFGPITGRLPLDLAVLFTLTVVILWIVERAMDWRHDDSSM